METKETTTMVLNDLVEINNDRIRGYEKAIKELKDTDSDLKVLFTGFIAESHTYKLALASEITSLGEEVEKGTTNSGKIYRAWMDLKALFTGHDRKAVLENCEFGEDAAQKAYKLALEEEGLPAYVRTLITEQKNALKEAHDKVRALRDSVH